MKARIMITWLEMRQKNVSFKVLLEGIVKVPDSGPETKYWDLGLGIETLKIFKCFKSFKKA